MVAVVDKDDVKLTEDLGPYERVRFHEARHAGLTRLESARFAYGTETLHTLWQLKADGCPAAVGDYPLTVGTTSHRIGRCVSGSTSTDSTSTTVGVS